MNDLEGNFRTGFESDNYRVMTRWPEVSSKTDKQELAFSFGRNELRNLQSKRFVEENRNEAAR